jgi:hypothetical protein
MYEQFPKKSTLNLHAFRLLQDREIVTEDFFLPRCQSCLSLKTYVYFFNSSTGTSAGTR